MYAALRPPFGCQVSGFIPQLLQEVYPSFFIIREGYAQAFDRFVLIFYKFLFIGLLKQVFLIVGKKPFC
jgi:hypothetical protein